MKNILITGSNGFIGKKLCTKLKNDYIIHTLPKNSDLLDPECFKNFSDVNIDIVIHLASATSVVESWKDPAKYYSVNTLGTQKILDFCLLKKASFNYVSSYMYGHPSIIPTPESEPSKPTNPYAHSKFLAEEICKFYAANFKLSVNVIRPFNIYGPFQDKSFLIPHIIDQILNSNQIEVMDLYPKRDFLYIEDAIEAISKVINLKNEFEIYNIGYGKSYSVQEIIDIAQEVFKTNKPIFSKNVIRPNELSDVIADISKISNTTHWRPKFSIEDGLKKIYSEINA